MCPDSSTDNTARRGEGRPTLPPIRDIFRGQQAILELPINIDSLGAIPVEELSQSLRPQRPTDSPSFSLSRLHVSDDEGGTPLHSLQAEMLYPGPLMGPGSRLPLPDAAPNPPSSIPRPHSSITPSSLFSSLSDFNDATISASRSLPSEILVPSQRSGAPSRLDLFPSSDPSMPYALESASESRPYSRIRAMAHASNPPSISSRSDSPYGSRGRRYSDAERTPRAEPDWSVPEATATMAPLSKYECSYCGKGFNRPSSLKIHLNSHTGEKPFVCPLEGCGRSFSVLSNMRRHARVHTQTPRIRREGSSEDGSDGPSPSLTASSGSPLAPVNSSSSATSEVVTASGSQHGRRTSNASSTSSQSHSRSTSPGDDIRPEKRSRRHPK